MAKEKVLTKAEILKQVEVVKDDLEKIPTGKVKKHLSGFTDFIRKQGVVGLAVGLAIGTQASELVKNIVSSIITPVADLLVGKDGLSGLTYTLRVGDRVATFNFGLLIDSTLKFLAVAFVIYVVIMGMKLDKLDRPKEK